MLKLFEDLREKLLIAGIAPRHVRRYLAELDDHFADLRGELGSEAAALARLGTANELAKPILAKPELRSWIARAPWAAMVVGPIATLAAVALVLLLILGGIGGSGIAFGWPAGFCARGHGCIEPMWFQVLTHTLTTFLVFVAPLLIGWAMSRLAVARRLAPLWPIVGLATFAVLSGMFDLSVTFPKVPGELGELSAGFGWGTPTTLSINAMHWIVNMILIVGPYLYWHQQRQIRWRHAEAV